MARAFLASMSAPILMSCALAGCVDKGGGAEDTGGDDSLGTDADGDGYSVADDCDDDDAEAHPDAVEVCDGIDNNCDGDVDEGVVGVWYTDADGDGFGATSGGTESCEAPDGTVADSSDCDDADDAIHPDAAERCNELDDDCDGDIDEDALSTWYLDADDDGYGDPAVTYDECDPPPGYVDNSDDCDDTDPLSSPDGVETCDEQDNNCDGDTDEGVTTTFYTDVDGDGYGSSAATVEACATPSGFSETADDCDDDDLAIYPGADEQCNGVDDNCDGDIDEDSAIDATTWYADDDVDGYGDASDTTAACAVPTGYVASDTDCDDTNTDIHPGAVETCDGGVDNDCNGDADDADSAVTGTSTWYLDYDGDSYGGTRYSADSCLPATGYVATNTDCDDIEAGVNPGATEVCNGIDDDCDSAIDADDTSLDTSTYTTFYADVDVDGYGDPATTTQACSVPSGSVTDGTDCDDSAASVNPGATEVCNSIDDDCDTLVDDDDSGLDTSTGSTWYADTDTDTFGDPSSTVDACDQPTGYVSDATDCDDTDSAINTDAVEACDGVDNDCDGAADDGTLGTSTTCYALSCDEVLADNPSATSGAYYLDPEGLGVYLNYCDMDDDGGGWTLLFTCSAPDATYGSGWDGWWEDGDAGTLDDLADVGKSLAYDEVDFSEVRLTATYPDTSTVVFSLSAAVDSMHNVVGTEITTCSGLTGTGRSSYTASTYTGSFWQSSTVTAVVCDTDGSSLETTSADNYDAAIFSTYTSNGDYHYVEGTLGTEYTCGGSASGYGAESSNMLSLWVR
jgi:large repetitive protein